MMYSLEFLRSGLLGAYFHQDWRGFEGTPFEIGEKFCAASPQRISERMIGLVDVVVGLDVSAERFERELQLMGVNYRDVEGLPSCRELMVELRSGMVSAFSAKLADVFDTGDLDDVKALLRSSLFDPYFYDGWESFDLDPFEAGLSFTGGLDNESSERVLGILATFIDGGFSADQFERFFAEAGFRHSGAEGLLSRRQILIEVHRGLTMVLSERTLKAIDDFESS